MLPEIPVGDGRGELVRLGVASLPVAGAGAGAAGGCGGFAVGTADWCTHACAARYSVGTRNNTLQVGVLLVAARAAISCSLAASLPGCLALVVQCQGTRALP